MSAPAWVLLVGAALVSIIVVLLLRAAHRRLPKKPCDTHRNPCNNPPRR